MDVSKRLSDPPNRKIIEADQDREIKTIGIEEIGANHPMGQANDEVFKWGIKQTMRIAKEHAIAETMELIPCELRRTCDVSCKINLKDIKILPDQKKGDAQIGYEYRCKKLSYSGGQGSPPIAIKPKALND